MYKYTNTNVIIIESMNKNKQTQIALHYLEHTKNRTKPSKHSLQHKRHTAREAERLWDGHTM